MNKCPNNRIQNFENVGSWGEWRSRSRSRCSRYAMCSSRLGVHPLSASSLALEDCIAQKSARNILSEQNTMLLINKSFSLCMAIHCTTTCNQRLVFNPNELWRWKMTQRIYSNSKNLIPITSIHAQPVKWKIYKNVRNCHHFTSMSFEQCMILLA